MQDIVVATLRITVDVFYRSRLSSRVPELLSVICDCDPRSSIKIEIAIYSLIRTTHHMLVSPTHPRSVIRNCNWWVHEVESGVFIAETTSQVDAPAARFGSYSEWFVWLY